MLGSYCLFHFFFQNIMSLVLFKMVDYVIINESPDIGIEYFLKIYSIFNFQAKTRSLSSHLNATLDHDEIDNKAQFMTAQDRFNIM